MKLLKSLALGFLTVIGMLLAIFGFAWLSTQFNGTGALVMIGLLSAVLVGMFTWLYYESENGAD